MDYFGKASGKIKNRIRDLVERFDGFIRRLIEPWYLFPLKLLTFSAFYFVKFLIKLLIAFIGLIIDCLVYPFKSLKNFLKSIVIIAVALYLAASLFVIADYLRTQYGWYGKFLCSYGVSSKLQSDVVRIVGGYSEGSGFFIAPDQVITNFHVIADEPSPKIIFADGKFVTPVVIFGNREMDLAVLIIKDKYPNLVLPLPDEISLKENEPLISVGYPLGTDLSGKATVLQGNFIDFRKSSKYPVSYLQTGISVVEGMSGGPLTDKCGNVVGINTLSLAGLSLFVNAKEAKIAVPAFSDQNITKINVDPSKSPEDAVRAYYTYLKARRMEDGFNLLSKEYLQKTNFEEWTNRFKDILDVDVIKSERYLNTINTAFVKFSTKNWVNSEAVMHYYEGTWTMVKEDGVFKIWKGKILEVDNPEWDWFYN